MKKMIPVIAAAVTVLALYGLDNLRDDSTVSQEGVQNSVSPTAASQADVFVQARREVDSHL